MTIPLEPCPASLSAEQVEAFRRDGFLAFRDVLTPEETVGACEALTQLVRRVARETSDRSGTFWMQPGSRLFLQFESEVQEGADEDTIELQVRKLMYFADEHPHLGYLAGGHPNIIAVVEGLLGAKARLFQDLALVKPPFIGSEKPWHQDNAYFSIAPLDAVCGVWIALDDATVENGCMHVLPGCHREVRKHIHDRDCEIPAAALPLDRVQAIEIPAGGALFFAGMLPHQTPPNTSPHRRRALQFHFRSARSRVLPRKKYDTLFREYNGMTGERVPASCAQGWKE